MHVQIARTFWFRARCVLFSLPGLSARGATSSGGKSQRTLRTASHYRRTGVDVAVSRGRGAAFLAVLLSWRGSAPPARVCTSETEAESRWERVTYGSVFITTLAQFSKLVTCPLNRAVMHALAAFFSCVIPPRLLLSSRTFFHLSSTNAGYRPRVLASLGNRG